MNQAFNVWAIPILTAVLGGLLTLWVNTMIIRKKRNYQLEDDRMNRYREYILSTLDLIEKTENEILSNAREILTQISEFRNNRLDAQTIRNSVAPIHGKLLHLSAMTRAFPNVELTSLLSTFENEFAEFTTMTYKVLSSVNRDNTDSLLIILGKLYDNLQTPYANIIACH